MRDGVVRWISSAQGIVAEIPQKSHGRFRGIGADSPVFCGFAAKNAPKPGIAAGKRISIDTKQVSHYSLENVYNMA
jgi:hypothetical protein